ncbi:MAG: tRNA (N(6)-L-threonylcarbamoyladenosine(37)-C(2))-methylthiotransferase MtaB [Lachnospiraceae bacterium]|nr:tRNA (N(6)-L-threonylcarbamoyladenosine(37)-C(2))-methylthiotransferase MtaB [Lachnospiraceae bacterium]
MEKSTRRKEKKLSKKAALHNLGCKVNAYETEAMQQLLEKAGYEIVPFTEYADVYIINTCSVTNMADRKSRQMLHRAKKENPDSIVVAAGCYVQTSPEQAKADESIDIIIGNNKKHELVDILAKYEADRPEKMNVKNINKAHEEYEEMQLEKTAEHTRAFLKVQDGCNQFCSYCIIPYARGRVRSRRTEDVVREVTTLAANGYHEVVLTGIHLSSFGIDREDNLLHLIREVHKIDGIERIRLGSLEPNIITEKFVSEIAKLPKLCPHFHLSLQSGCDATLARMNRRYDTASYAAKCELLRRYYEHPAITTDVIVGFPGETEEEFETTKEFLKRIHFYEMHIFKYSKRQGTKAAVMKDQVPEPVKTTRSARLIELEQQMSREFREYYVGKEVTALLEETFEYEGETYLTGYTKEYVKIAVKVPENQAAEKANTFVRGKISQCLTGEIYLMVEF